MAPSGLPQKRVGCAFLADRAGRPVAADERDVVAQGENLFPDRAEQLRMVAARYVGAPDRAAEQHVADNGEALRGIEQGDAARRMARAVQDIEGQLADLYLIALVEPAFRRDVARTGHPEGAAALGQAFEQKPVGAVRPLDRHVTTRAETLLELGGAAGVIDMTMGEPDLIDAHTGLRDRILDPRQIASRVDHGRAPGRLAPQDGAVLR